MKSLAKIFAAVLVAAVPLVGFGDDESKDQPKLSCIKDITFSPEFLAKYPAAGAACREVVMKNGEKWARFDANVVKVKGNEVTADFIDNYGQTISTLTFVASADARVIEDGKQVKFSSLEPGHKLTFYVPESRVGFYAAPGSAQGTTKLAVVSETSKVR
jgi:hypothetical protein